MAGPIRTAKPTMQSASGYRVYQFLNSPLFAKEMIHRTYHDTVTGVITSHSVVPSEIRDVGDQITFRKAPVGEIFNYQKNQPLEFSELNTETVTMVINRAKYWNLKLDEIDVKQIQNIKTWVNEFIVNCQEQLKQQIDFEVLDYVPRKADPFNRGSRAGKVSGMYDLGMYGRPIHLDGENFLQYIGFLAAVLDEAQCPMRGRYLVLPGSARTLFLQNKWLNDMSQTGNKPVMLAETTPSIAGFKIYFSHNMPSYVDPNHKDKRAHLIVAGLDTATGFVTQMTKQQHIDQVETSFAQYWRGLQVYDFEVIRPEHIATLYATVNFNKPAGLGGN